MMLRNLRPQLINLILFIGLCFQCDIKVAGKSRDSEFLLKFADAGEIITAARNQEMNQALWYFGTRGLSRRKRDMTNEKQEGLNVKQNFRVKRYIGNYGKKKPPVLDKKCCLNAFFCVPWACIPTIISWKKVPAEFHNLDTKPGCICNDPYFCPPGCVLDPSIVDHNSEVYKPKTKKPGHHKSNHH